MVFAPREDERPCGADCRTPKNGADSSILAREYIRASVDALVQRAACFNEKTAVEGWSVRLGDAQDGRRPAVCRGCGLIWGGAPVIVGMSLENSYFSRERITRLFRFLAALESDVFALIMDQPAEHNYRALGFGPEETVRKIKSRSADLRRAVRQAMRADELGPGAGKFHELPWEGVRGDEDFQRQLRTLREIYSSDSRFREDVERPVREYLKSGLRRLGRADLPGPKMVEGASAYALEELALVLASPRIMACPASVYLYHRGWPPFERLMTGGYGQPPAAGVGFLELEVVDGPAVVP